MTHSKRDWLKTTLGDLVDICKKQISPMSSPDTVFAHYSIPAFDNNKKVSLDSGSAIKSNKFIVPPGIVLLSRINPRIPRVWSPEILDGTPAICSTEFIVLLPRSIDRLFLHYLCLAPSFRDLLLQCVTGTSGSHQRVHPTSVLNFEIIVPSIYEQKAIAHVLSELDNKIELNRKMNRTLEATAQAIFQDWFVDFGPTLAKVNGRQPYLPPDLWDLFPSIIDSDGRPIGWEEKLLEGLVVIKKGQSVTKKSVVEGKIPVVAGGLKPAYFHNTTNAVAPVITVSASGVNAGYVTLYLEDIWASDCSYLSINDNPNILFWYAMLNSCQNEIFSMQQGTAQPHIYPKHLNRMRVTVPPKILVEKYSKFVEANYSQIANLQAQNRLLTIARDTLLPKLINGEIAV